MPRRSKRRYVSPFLRVRKGPMLRKYGYSTRRRTKQRRRSLLRATRIGYMAPSMITRRLHRLAILNSNRSPKAANVLRRDYVWYKKMTAK